MEEVGSGNNSPPFENQTTASGVSDGLPSQADKLVRHPTTDHLLSNSEIAVPEKPGKCFFYDAPYTEETGVWIPVSVPPMSATEHHDFTKGFHYFPDRDLNWDQFEEDKELTVWDVVSEILLAARGKVSSMAYGNVANHSLSWVSSHSHLLEQAWQEMAQTLTEANFGNIHQMLDADPPRWLADSAASACMLCGLRFHPLVNPRHHCRFCGGIFCGDCSRGRTLMPPKFRLSDPQRVCDVCCVRLESIQPYLIDQISNAAQTPTHDLTDLSTVRSWLNFPWGSTMEYEIYKAANAIKSYSKGIDAGKLDAVLKDAKGLAVITGVKFGVGVTYNVGTGIIIARRDDRSWSPPSAVSTFGMGWGAQMGGELMDMLIVLRTREAVRMFTGTAHVSFGAGASAAVGVFGRTVEAGVRGGDRGFAACYSYSRSKGVFVGCSAEGSVVTTRGRTNKRFYGNQAISAGDILLGRMPRPPAAAVLYRAVDDLYQRF